MGGGRSTRLSGGGQVMRDGVVAMGAKVVNVMLHVPAFSALGARGVPRACIFRARGDSTAGLCCLARGRGGES